MREGNAQDKLNRSLTSYVKRQLKRLFEMCLNICFETRLKKCRERHPKIPFERCLKHCLRDCLRDFQDVFDDMLQNTD